MDSKIELLLEKYWKCETSLEEEKELRDFFNGQAVPEGLKETADLFKYFELQRNEKLSATDFDSRLQAHTRGKQGRTVKMFFTSAKIAAGVAVLIAAGYLVREEIRKSYPTEVADTYSDPELAFEETKKALLMISKTFGKAKQEAGKISVFNEAEQIIQHGTAKEGQVEQVDI